MQTVCPNCKIPLFMSVIQNNQMVAGETPSEEFRSLGIKALSVETPDFGRVKKLRASCPACNYYEEEDVDLHLNELPLIPAYTPEPLPPSDCPGTAMLAAQTVVFESETQAAAIAKLPPPPPPAKGSFGYRGK